MLTCLFRGSKSRNKVSVGEPAEGSLTRIHVSTICALTILQPPAVEDVLVSYLLRSPVMVVIVNPIFLPLFHHLSNLFGPAETRRNKLRNKNNS